MVIALVAGSSYLLGVLVGIFLMKRHLQKNLVLKDPVLRTIAMKILKDQSEK